MRRKTLSILLALTLVLGLLPVSAMAAGSPFADVSAGAYYADAVEWAVEKGITTGTSDTTFSPENGCTRGQVVTFLWRCAGKPAVFHPAAFTDVPADAYYADAVAWAVEMGITNGTGETTFSPDDTCTRGQIVTFLWRCAGTRSAEASGTFSDVHAGAYYAGAVTWAVSRNITNGTGAGSFSPENTCTRGQIVTFLFRYVTDPGHAHNWFDHYTEKQTLVEGYWEDVYQKVPVYETIGLINGIHFDSMTEQNAYIRSLGPDAEVVHTTITVITGYRDELVDRVWHDPVYTTERSVDYCYCACGKTK